MIPRRRIPGNEHTANQTNEETKQESLYGLREGTTEGQQQCGRHRVVREERVLKIDYTLFSGFLLSDLVFAFELRGHRQGTFLLSGESVPVTEQGKESISSDTQPNWQPWKHLNLIWHLWRNVYRINSVVGCCCCGIAFDLVSLCAAQCASFPCCWLLKPVQLERPWT